MSAARPPEGARRRSPQGEGTRISAARPPESARRRSPQGEGTRISAARPPEGAPRIGYRWASMVLLGLTLAACGGSSSDELQKWMADQRNLTRPKVTPIAEPKVFKPESYQQAGVMEPFSKEKLTQALKRDGAQVVSNAGLVAPELARRKQPLEAFPLDSMTLVGSMVQAGRPVALVRVNNLLYQVRPGDYLGLNYGLVTKISETEVALREIVQDAVGEWIERTASLQLQERSR